MDGQRLRIGFYGLWIGLVAVIVAAWYSGSGLLLRTGTGPALLAAARLVGLLSAFSLLWQLVLVSRARWLERIHGFDRWTRIHRLNGFSAFALITAHIPLIIGGYAVSGDLSSTEQAGILLSEFDYVWLAALGYALLIVTVGLSVTRLRRLRYETWYYLHLLNYAVVVLVFWHQITHGLTLLGSDWFRFFWYGLHAGVAAHLLWFRLLVPIKLNRHHRFRVERVVPETADTYSYYIRGRNLADYRYSGGQFAKWRFWQRGLWPEEHPFTLSLAAGGDRLRITVKQIGDYTTRLQQVRPGARVWASPPLGAFTLARAGREKLLFIAGGIGITPIRALLGAANPDRDIVVLYTARTARNFALAKEIEELTAGAHRRLHYITSQEPAAGAEFGVIDKQLLERLVADATEREVFLCGPPQMMAAVTQALGELGLDENCIHSERFSL